MNWKVGAVSCLAVSRCATVLTIGLSVAGCGPAQTDQLNLPPVRDGKLEFTLLTWNGNAGKLRVQNIGKYSVSYDGSYQKAVDAQGREFDCDGGERRHMQPGDYYTDNSLTCRNGTIPIDHLEVHDDILSWGTELKLPPLTASTTTPPPRPDKHSQIANIALPPEASLNTAPSSRGEEMWDIAPSACTDPHGGFSDCIFGHTPSWKEVVAAMDARLPVDHPLDGMPWCGRSQTGTDEVGHPIADNANTNWAWGTAADMVHVSVEKSMSTGGTFIEITRGPARHPAATPDEPARCKP
jgi:hypothetical protein